MFLFLFCELTTAGTGARITKKKNHKGHFNKAFKHQTSEHRAEWCSGEETERNNSALTGITNEALKQQWGHFLSSARNALL